MSSIRPRVRSGAARTALGVAWVAALVLAIPPAAAAPGAGVAAEEAASGLADAVTPERFKIERHTLPNGLVVLTHEDHSVPTITFWQWYRVGSRNEAPGITGISHFFEHMMFNGSKHVPPKEYDRILESNGGYSNAFTDRDMTAYYEEVAADRLETVLFLDADRMAALSLLPEQLKSEIEVVKEERRLRTENDIAGLLDEQLYATAFVASPYHWPVLGWMGDLNRIRRGEMVDYFRTHYAPNNCILVLAGDFDTRDARVRIQKAFGPIPAQKPPAPPVNSEPDQRGERRAEVHYPAQSVSFEIGYHTPGVKSPDGLVLDVLSSILSEGESSRLHQALVYEQQIALSASTTFQTRLDPGLFEVYVEMKPGKSGAEGEKAVDDVLARLIAEGPTARELDKAKHQLEANFIRQLKTNNGVGQTIGFYEHVYGDYRELFRTLPRYRAVTAADCQRVARQVFDPLRRTVVTIVPDTTAAQASP